MMYSSNLSWYLVGAGASVCALLGTWYVVDEGVQKKVHDTAFDLAFSVITSSIRIKECICAKIYGTDFYKITRVFWLHNDTNYAEDITKYCKSLILSNISVNEIHEHFRTDGIILPISGYLCIEYMINIDGYTRDDNSHNTKEYRVIYKDRITFPPYDMQDTPRSTDNEVLMATLFRNGETHDVTDEIIKYMGPCNDFYKGINSMDNIDLYIPIHGFVKSTDVLIIQWNTNVEQEFTGIMQINS